MKMSSTYLKHPIIWSFNETDTAVYAPYTGYIGKGKVVLVLN
jgi:hypothetical protein